MKARFNMRRVLGAMLVIVLAAVAWWGWSARMGVRPEAQAKPAEPFVQLAAAGRAAEAKVLQERAELLDPTPMFLPTERNAGQTGLPGRLVPRPGQVFADFAPRLSVGEANLPNYGADSAEVPEGLTDVMAKSNEAPFAGLGEGTVRPQQVAQRTAFVEIKNMKGNNLLTQAVTTPLPRPDFAPLEFLATVSAAGLVGDPQLVASSGAEDVDVFFRDHLAKALRIGERLGPGVYRIVVGP